MIDLKQVQSYIDNNNLLTNKVIVGLSGGADSIALIHILTSLQYDCVAAHCNFHLRGEESNRDANFVKQFCSRNNIELEYIDFDTIEFAQEKRISIEMAARELRYTWFEEIRVKYNAEAIAVAHHLDDSVETVLLNLIRGTGVRGLTGISPKNGYIIRPLLEVGRKDIEDYLAEHNIDYVNDSTNAEDIYTRNKIRLNILPLMESINPSVKQSINRTAQHINQVKNIYFEYIEKAKKKIIADNKIDINKLKEYTEPKAVLFEILSDFNFNGATVDDIYSNLDAISGKLFYSDTHKLLKDRDYLIIEQVIKNKQRLEYSIEKEDEIISHPLQLRVSYHKNDVDFKLKKSKTILYLDASQLSYPLTIRQWEQGDWFIPFGMKGRKKISDYFSDQKFSLFDKENTWLLCSDDDIIWIVGHRSDDRYRITDSTQNIVQIELL